MAKGAKYWVVEQPREIITEKNVIKCFPDNGKLQVFPRISSAPNGVGKGATIDLEAMSVEQLQQLGACVAELIKSQLDTQFV
jgi:hypothetical protein